MTQPQIGSMRTPPENATDLCFAHELHYSEPPSNRSSIERDNGGSYRHTRGTSP
jgi:hypothetical protein